MNLSELLKTDNRWRQIARNTLKADAGQKTEPDPVEFVERVDVLGREVYVPIHLSELKAVSESAKEINRHKMIDCIEHARSIQKELSTGLGLTDEATLRLGEALFSARVVHDRSYVSTYAFWKAVEMMGAKRRRG